MVQVIIGIDPHKGSHTALALDQGESKLGQPRVIAAPGQVEQLQRWAASWPERVWAIEGARGLGRLLAQQLIGAGERVVDVQPKLAARVRLLNTGQVNKNDPNDARSVAVAALRTRSAVEVVEEDATSVMKLWSRRYHDLGSLRTQLVCRLHAVLCDLVPGGFARRISAAQAIQVLDSLTVHGAVAAAKLELAHELVTDLQRIDEQRSEVKRRLTRTVTASKTTLTGIYGVGPIIAATVLGYVGDVHRFPTRDHFASYNGTAPIEASSGNHTIHRLSRRGNRQVNHAIHMAAVTQIRNHGDRTDLLRPQGRRGHRPQSRAARSQTQHQRRHLRPTRGRRPSHPPSRREGPGRAIGERLCIQRDRLTPRDTSSSEKPLPGLSQPYDQPTRGAATPTIEDSPPRLLTQRGLDMGADRPWLRGAQMSCFGRFRTSYAKAPARLPQLLLAGPRWSYGNE